MTPGLVLPSVEPGVPALPWGGVGGLGVVGTPELPCDPGGEPGGAVEAGLGWGLLLSSPWSSGDIELVPSELPVGSAWRECREEVTGETPNPVSSAQ